MTKQRKNPKTGSATTAASLHRPKASAKTFGILTKKRIKKSGANLAGGKQDAWRYLIIGGLMLCIFMAIFARAFYLQIVNPQFFIDKGDELIKGKRIEPAY